MQSNFSFLVKRNLFNVFYVKVIFYNCINNKVVNITNDKFKHKYVSCISSNCKRIGATYIHIRFINQMPNRFESNLDIRIRNFNSYPTKRIGFGYKLDPLMGLILTRSVHGSVNRTALLNRKSNQFSV